MTTLERAKALIEREDYQGAIAILENKAILENETDKELTREYFGLYGLALFGQGLAEQAKDTWLEGLLVQNYGDDAVQLLIEQLTSYAKQQSDKPVNISIEKIYQVSGIIAELNEEYYQEIYFPSLSSYLEKAKKEALSLAMARKKVEAKIIYEILIIFFPHDADLFYQLSMICYELEEYAVALENCFKAVNLNSQNALYYYGLGLIFEKLDNYQQAANAYSQAIDKDKQKANAYINLGNILIKTNQSDAAENLYKMSIENDVKHFGIYVNYGNLLLAKNKTLEAIELYQKAIPLFRDYPDIYYNLAIALEKKGDIVEAQVNRGRALFREGKDDEAFAIFEACRAAHDDDWDYWNEIADYYIKAKRYEFLSEKLWEGCQKFPDSIRQRTYLIESLSRLHKNQEAYQFASECITYFDTDPAKQLIFKLYRQLVLPIIYYSKQEIEEVHGRYIRDLEDIANNLKLSPDFDKTYIMFALLMKSAYYLHFHGINSLKLQISQGRIIHAVVRTYYADFIKKIEIKPFSKNKFRVGYVCVRSHNLGQLFLGWIDQLNSEKFETFFYDMGETVDAKTERFRIFSNHYYHYPWSLNIEDIAQKIRDDELDILVFLDPEIEPRLHCLTFFRLAPIQCATWGHPITTGSPNVDYFLGSDAMEPANAQEHYSEKLVRLPKLGIYLEPVQVPELSLDRQDFDIQKEDIIYISCQMTAKYLPQHDYLYPEIMQKVPNAKIIFFNAYESDDVTQKFQERLSNAFANYGLNFSDHCLFSPRINHKRFLNLMMLADVCLDTPSWSGCITTWDMVACGLPIVTLPGELMRGRQTYGTLKIMDVTDTVAMDEADYIKIAVQLGSDANFRHTVRQKLIQNRHKLYFDSDCINFLEGFYDEVIRTTYSEQFTK